MVLKITLPRLFLILCTLVLGAATTCPQFFTFKSGHCIHISTDSKTYCEAQTFCRSIGGELATGERVTQLKSFFSGYLIGMSDLLDETSFRWTDGSFAPTRMFARELRFQYRVETLDST